MKASSDREGEDPVGIRRLDTNSITVNGTIILVFQ